ncbi:MAG: class B sortase, partial [Oscillospiraceae bacterium]
GWIEVPNTKISYPVVLRKGAEEGNEYYLARKFNGEQARAGTIFVDYRTTIQDRKQSDNLVLYGHNEINNTMFGDLDLYKNENAQNIFGEKSLEFYKQNPTFTFDTNYEEATYKIFAVFITPIDQKWDTKHDIFDYNNYIDFDEARYDDFIKKANERSRIKTDIDTKFGDKFVTLSTCSREFEDSRLVVIGRKVRPGENPTVNLEKVDHNEDAIELDWDTIYAK